MTATRRALESAREPDENYNTEEACHTLISHDITAATRALLYARRRLRRLPDDNTDTYAPRRTGRHAGYGLRDRDWL